MATLKDIAELAGVSVPTVSKILNNKNQKCASSETQDRIWKAVRELGYRPNIHAKKIASITSPATETNIIAICLCGRHNSFFLNYYKAVQRSLELRILSLAYMPYTCAIEQIMEKKSPLLGRRMVGAVIIGEPDTTLLNKLSKTAFSLVVLSLMDEIIPYDKVFCSFRNAVHKAVAEISGKAYYVGQKDPATAGICGEYNIRILYSDCTISGGYISGMLIMEDDCIPEIVICEGRDIASGIQKAFCNKGIPFQSVHFLVLDDLCGTIEENMYQSAYIDMAGTECAGLALDLLIDRIQHRHKLSVTYEVDSCILSPETGGV